MDIFMRMEFFIQTAVLSVSLYTNVAGEFINGKYLNLMYV